MEDRNFFNHHQINLSQIESYVEGILDKYAKFGKEYSIVFNEKSCGRFLLKFKINLVLTGEIVLSSYLIPSFKKDKRIDMIDDYDDDYHHIEDINLKGIKYNDLIKKIEKIMLRITKMVFSLGTKHGDEILLEIRYVIFGSCGKLSEENAPMIGRLKYFDFLKTLNSLEPYHFKMIETNAVNISDCVFSDKVMIKNSNNKLVIVF